MSELIANLKCRKSFIVAVALFLSTLQYLIASVLNFYGHVIEPTLTHQVLSTASIAMTLPFSLGYFIRIGAEVDVYINVLSSLAIYVFWTYVYYRILKKRFANSELL